MKRVWFLPLLISASLLTAGERIDVYVGFHMTASAVSALGTAEYKWDGVGMPDPQKTYIADGVHSIVGGFSNRRARRCNLQGKPIRLTRRKGGRAPAGYRLRVECP